MRASCQENGLPGWPIVYGNEPLSLVPSDASSVYIARLRLCDLYCRVPEVLHDWANRRS